MSRADGFDVADTDTGLMADPKVLVLARRLRDSSRTGAALALYESVRLASWKAGRRLTLDESLPGWWLDPVDELAEHLVAVGLLDAERRIPEHAWEGWFGPALDRKLESRRKAIFGGLVSRGMTQAQANAEADRRIAEARERYGMRPVEPIRLNLLGSTSVRSVPTDRSVTSRVRARGTGFEALRDTAQGLGFGEPRKP